MSEIADFLRARIAERRALAMAASHGPWEGVVDRHQRGVVDASVWSDKLGYYIIEKISSGDRHEADARHIAANDPAAVIADCDAKLALIDEIEPPLPADPESDPQEPETGWCCNGYVSECPLCPQYGTSLLDPCPGHPGTGENKTRVVEAQLHAVESHAAYEYRTTTGPRKQWDDIDQPPYGDEGEPDASWERNIDAGRPGQGWDRFDYTEESYWRRPRPDGPRPVRIPRGLRIMAQPFAGHPDHKGEEWAP